MPHFLWIKKYKIFNFFHSFLTYIHATESEWFNPCLRLCNHSKIINNNSDKRKKVKFPEVVWLPCNVACHGRKSIQTFLLCYTWFIAYTFYVRWSIVRPKEGQYVWSSFSLIVLPRKMSYKMWIRSCIFQSKSEILLSCDRTIWNICSQLIQNSLCSQHSYRNSLLHSIRFRLIILNTII